MIQEQENFNIDEMQALSSVKFNDYRKKANAAGWSDNMELLLKMWGEKAAGLRYMHAHSGGQWKQFANKLSIYGILVTGVVSTLSLAATSLDNEETKDAILIGVGGIGLVSTLIQSFKKFYNAEEKAADHSSVSKQFGSYYRYMTLQMSMSREDREPADVLSQWALKEYERLQQEAPPINGESIALFKKNFDKTLQAIPDVAEDKFVINIFKNKNLVLQKKDIEIVNSSNNVLENNSIKDEEVEVLIKQ